MFRYSCLRGVLLVLLAMSSSHAGEMDGEWKSIALIRAGTQQVDAPAEAVIKDGKFRTVRDGKMSDVGKISEVIGVSPSQYNVELTGDAEVHGKSFHGIFAISADTMFTCVNRTPDGERPAEFKSTKENGYILIIWMRKVAISTTEHESK